jgi:transcriptional regulator with XRE-family HTH domain
MTTEAHDLFTLNATIGRNVRSLREQAELTQAQLARRAKVARRSISQIEGGTRRPRDMTLEAIARALNVHTRDLLMLTAPRCHDCGAECAVCSSRMFNLRQEVAIRTSP